MNTYRINTQIGNLVGIGVDPNPAVVKDITYVNGYMFSKYEPAKVFENMNDAHRVMVAIRNTYNYIIGRTVNVVTI